MKYYFSKIRIPDLLLSLVLIALPFSIKLTNGILLVLIASWLYAEKNTLKKYFYKEARSIVILLIPFLFILVSSFYSASSFLTKWHAIEKYFPLAAFPIIFGTLSIRKNDDFLLEIFASVILCICIVNFSFGLYNFFVIPEGEQLLVGDNYNKIPSKWNALSNTVLMRPFSINPIYMSLYISFAVLVVLFESRRKLEIKIPVLIFLVVFQLLAGSRIGLLAFFITVGGIVFLIKRRRLKMLALSSLVLSILALVIIIHLNPVLKKRYTSDIISADLPRDVSGWNGLSIRRAIWICSYNLFLESPYVGYGVAFESAIRERCYQKYSFYGPFGTNLNSHNQYLEFSLIGGAMLLCLFLFQLGYSGWLAVKSNSVLHLMFLALFVLTCFGESVLEVHKGIVFFAYFNSMFCFPKRKLNIE